MKVWMRPRQAWRSHGFHCFLQVFDTLRTFCLDETLGRARVCFKTQYFSMISSSNVEKYNAFRLFQAQMLQNTSVFFNDVKLEC